MCGACLLSHPTDATTLLRRFFFVSLSSQVTDFYGANITTTIHTFPLPYHNNGFMVAQAAHTAMDAQPTNAKLPRAFADFMFTNQVRGCARHAVAVSLFRS